MGTISPIVSVIVLTLFLVATASSQGSIDASKYFCPEYPANKTCVVSPCESGGNKKCGPDLICCEDYSRNCEYHCINTGSRLLPPSPFSECPIFEGDPRKRCVRNPCDDIERCISDDETCCSATNGCDYKCIGPK